MLKKGFILFSLLFSINLSFAQTSGIKILINDKKSEQPITNAVALLLLNGNEISKIAPDSNGFAKFQPIDTAIYNIRVESPLYRDYTLIGVHVFEDMITHIEIQMRLKSDSAMDSKTIYGNVCTMGFPISKGSCWSTGIFESKDINRLPTNNINYILDFFPGH